MIDPAINLCRRLLARWLDLVQRAAWLVAVTAVLSGVAIGAYVVRNISINTDTTDMLSPELPFRRDARALTEAFPQYSDNILLVVDGDTPDIADDAASALAKELRKEPGLFGEIYDLAGDPYFRKNGLLYLEPDALYELSDRLAEAQPFLGVLWRDPSLRGFFGMFGLAIDESLKSGGDGPIEINAVLNAISDVIAAQASGRFRNLSWQDLMSGRPASKDERRRFILLQPALDFTSLQPAAKTMKALRRLANELKLDEQHGVRVRITGSAALSHEELESVEEGMGVAAILSLFLVVGLLLAGLGSPRLAASILVTLVIGLIWTAGFGVAALGQFNLISVAFAVLFIGLSVDFGIHFGLRYKEEIDRGHEHERALGAAGTGVGGALTLCAVTAAIGFYSFLPTAYLGLAELGLIAGTGMFIALFTNITVLPALLTIVTIPPAPPLGKRSRGEAVQPFIAEHAVSIVWGALAVGLASLALVPQVRFDFDPMNLRNPMTESVSTLFDLMENSRNGPYSVTILAKDLAAARELGGKLAELDPVDTTLTLFDYVPRDQDQKLEVIGSMALFLSPSLSATDHPPPPTAGQRRKAAEDLRSRLERLSGSSLDGAVAARDLMTKLAALTASDSTADRNLAELETRLLANLPGRLEMLRQSLEAEPVTVEDLPESLRQRSVAEDGRARLEVFPKENLQDGTALRRFVEAVRTLAPNATGAPVIILEAGKAVVAAFRDAAIIAVVCISILLVVLLRSGRDVLLVFAPLTLAALMTIAATVALKLPFNFANVIVLPLLFGLGVASGIHIVLRERKEQGTNGALATSTPRAVVFSALTTIGSFASIALSSHPGTASMGVLLAVAISLTLICTLVVLPALVAIVKQGDGDEEGRAP